MGGDINAHAAVLDQLGQSAVAENPTALEEAAEGEAAGLVGQALDGIGVHEIIVNLEEIAVPTTPDTYMSDAVREQRMNAAAGLVVSALTEQGWLVHPNNPLGVSQSGLRANEALSAELGLRPRAPDAAPDSLKRFVVFFKVSLIYAEPDAPSA
ncbi:hypothetical protein H6802_01345 [Candidatus Nomurabacteria bacterium]|nr:hypothetical protein [Candidatus Nomurabacteria bacterium]MCB9827380.1 hypothetical protein [Candidatus Nomurabacteria bacterium]HXK52638.1 hypothetical protein [bacterium]